MIVGRTLIVVCTILEGGRAERPIMRINVDDAHLPCSLIDAFRNSSLTKEVGRDFFKARNPSDTDDDPPEKHSSDDSSS